ncbi:ROS/MUCR transcriptional regulator family protein (plasmid) [Blastomonas sp. RAC04]|nr:ROS/MUCR transcriptional regulator family protein [Blastomonas sp. RAC04]
MLKSYLRTKFGMTPDEYRAKWNLPKDYPMVSPNYTARRSALAKEFGLGKSGRGSRPKKTISN